MNLKKSLIALLTTSSMVINAQTAGFNILEKDYEITRKAKKGYLGGVEETTNGGFDLVYFLPSRKKMVKIENRKKLQNRHQIKMIPI